jgi:hypothetical protein
VNRGSGHRQDQEDPERDPPSVMYVNTVDLHSFLLRVSSEPLYLRIPNHLKIKVMVTWEL